MNTVVAWTSAVLVILSISIWPLRLLCEKHKDSAALRVVRKVLLKIHIPIGILSVVVVFIHCQMEKTEVAERSPLGGFLLICLITLAITGMARKLFPRWWLRAHKVVSAILLVGTIIHSVIGAIN